MELARTDLYPGCRMVDDGGMTLHKCAQMAAAFIIRTRLRFSHVVQRCPVHWHCFPHSRVSPSMQGKCLQMLASVRIGRAAYWETETFQFAVPFALEYDKPIHAPKT